jgi:diaminopimelate decarboxylase
MTNLREAILPNAATNQCPFPVSAAARADGGLDIGGCSLAALAAEHATPLRVVCETTLRTALRDMSDSLRAAYDPAARTTVLFALKAWPHPALAAVAASEGCGFDAASEGELRVALGAASASSAVSASSASSGTATASTSSTSASAPAGLSAPCVYLHGNNKSRAELRLAVDNGVTVVANSIREIETLAEVAREAEREALVMPRVTPGIDVHVHEYIRTGQFDTKFGVPIDAFDDAVAALHKHEAAGSLRCVGVHAHVGSQVFQLEPYRDLAKVLVSLLCRARAAGLASATRLNMGGGIGTAYTRADAAAPPPSVAAWAACVAGSVRSECATQGFSPVPDLLVETGRAVVSSAAVTAYTVGEVREVPGVRTFVAVDGGQSDNIRPCLYGAEYGAIVARDLSVATTGDVGTRFRDSMVACNAPDAPDAPDARTNGVWTVVGKHCESGDILIRDLCTHVEPREGDILAVLCTGAYNASMSSNYNLLPRPAAVLVSDGTARLISRRETFDHMMACHVVPVDLQ